MNKSKLIDYLLGHITPENDKELAELLKNKDAESELAIYASQLENIAMDVPNVTPSKKLKESIFAHLEQSGSQKFAGFVNRLSQFFQLPIATINTILDAVSDTSLPVWDKAMIDGAFLYHFNAGGDIADAHCGLIYLEPGTEITEHEHLGEEKMLVIQGEVTTSDGRTYQVGEVAISDEGTSHTLKAGADSVCVFGVIANGGVDFKES